MGKIDSLFNEWQALQPVKEEVQQRLDKKFMLEFNYNSNHIEGNTLTYGQTEFLLMFGKVVDGANMKDLEDMKASNVGLKMVKLEAEDMDRPLTESFIRELHRTLLREDYEEQREYPDGSVRSYTVHAGVYKTRPNSVKTITGEMFEYASPEETPSLMTDLVQWYNEEEQKKQMSPIELATLFHYRYIRIHPFEDGNGRVSRLIVNYILHKHGYPMIVVKSSDKNNYLTALNRCDVAVGPVPYDGAHAVLSQIAPFVEYLSQCLIRALEICIKGAKGESIEEADDWRKNLKLKYRNQINKPEVTEDVANKIIDEDFVTLLNHIDSELSEFYSVFSYVNWKPGKGVYNVLDDGHYCTDIWFSKEFGIFNPSFNIRIELKIQQFMYKLKVCILRDRQVEKVLYKKDLSYTDSLSEKDKNDVVNAIGNYLNEFIETQGFSKKA